MSDSNFYRVRQGAINEHGYDPENLRLYRDSEKTVHFIRQALNAIYEKAIQGSHEGSWNAFVLHSKVEYEKSPNDVSISDHLGVKRRRIKVIARVPDLDAAIPLPDILGLPSEMTPRDQMLLSLHRVFYSKHTGNASLPSIGDQIEVDFEDRKNHRYGIYKGILEKGNGSIPDAEPTDQAGSGKVQVYFQENVKNIKLVKDFVQPEHETNQEAKNLDLSNLIGVPVMAISKMENG